MTKNFKSTASIILAGIVSAVLLTACTGGKSSSDNAAETTAATTAAETTAPAEPVSLTISAAASLTDVMEQLAEMYKEKAPNVTITYNFGSSGALLTQIEEGAPADIFMSAAQKQMKALEEKDMLLADTRKDLLINKIVLITPADSDKEITGFEDVTTDKVKKIALGDPAGVPAGQYAEQVFTFLNILEPVKTKAVYGSDVRQVLTWVESGEADCGIVYATDAATASVEVIAEAPEDSHDPVLYPVAVLKDSKNQDAAKDFLAFISAEDAAAVFEKFGFTVK